jgi:hypothetical protein
MHIILFFFFYQEKISFCPFCPGRLFSGTKIKTIMGKIVGIDVGIKNLALCCQEDGVPVHWDVIDVLGEGKNATKTSIEDCCTAMMSALVALPWWAELTAEDTVAIEAQPCGRVATGNTKCKVLSHCIQSFVLLKTKARPIFVNPKTKVGAEVLATYGNADLEGDTNVKKRYKIHKAAAIKMVEQMVVEKLPQWKEWYEGLKKKDDAADAYLLTLVAAKKKVKKKRKRGE